MHRILRSTLLTALTLAGAVWLAGCSSAPMGPGSNEVKNPVFLTAAPPAAGTFSAGAATSGLSGSAAIDGALGGSLQVGRFSLTVPAGAYQGMATVTINVPDATIVRCQLGITPMSANQFTIPVVMRSDCTGTDALSAASLCEIWYDAAADVWRQVPGSTPDIVNFDVIAPLTHFSEYGVIEGKAGW